MHEIGTHVIEIQIATIPMKSLSFLMQCAPFVNISANYSLGRGLGQCRCVLCCDGIIGRVLDWWANQDTERNAHKLIVT